MVEPISARDIAVSGLRAQRTRMNIIANNIANWETTRTPEGGPFRRQMVVIRGDQIGPGLNPGDAGIRVKRVVHDQSPFRPVYRPNHPDADADGYVMYPNVDLAIEQVDLLSAQRAYEANIAVIRSGSQMKQQALRILEK